MFEGSLKGARHGVGVYLFVNGFEGEGLGIIVSVTHCSHSRTEGG